MPLESNQTRLATKIQSSTAAPPNLTDPLPCPRCNSTITKFCYYNNYHLSQPRYFCRSCRRYWTHGGTLRDVPVGGGTRRNTSSKRHRSFSSSSSSSSSCSSLTTTTTTTTKSETAMKKGEDKNEGNNVISGYGSFASLLDGEGAAAFLALGSGSNCGFGFGGGDTWQFGDVDGSKSGDSFIWPAL